MIQDQKPKIPNLNIPKASEYLIGDSVGIDHQEEQKPLGTNTSRKLTNKERQNAIFGPQQQVEQHQSATKQYHQLEQCKKQASELINELNSEKELLSESIQILNEQIMHENIDIFNEIKEKMKKIHENFKQEIQNAYEEQNKVESEVVEVRKGKHELYEMLYQTKGMFDRNFENIGYTSEDMQNLSQSINIHDSFSPAFTNISILQSPRK